MAGDREELIRRGLQAEPSRAPRSLRILIVDDERDTVLTLMTLLRHEGHEVWTLYKAKDVLRAMKHFDPDVVLLDIGLPDGSGFDVAEQIRRAFGRARPMLIAVTGLYKQGVDKSEVEAVGFDHFITKPFETDLLLRLMAPLQMPQPPEGTT